MPATGAMAAASAVRRSIVPTRRVEKKNSAAARATGPEKLKLSSAPVRAKSKWSRVSATDGSSRSR